MSGENPYAPPQTASVAVPDAPESFGWELVGNRVWAEKFAQFPMVDPYSGKTDEVMLLHKINVRQRPIWQLALSIILVGACFAPFLLPIGQEWKLTLFVGSLLLLLVVVIGGMFFPVVSVGVFYCRRTLKIYAVQRCLLVGLYLIGTVLGNSRSLSHSLGVGWMPCVLLITWLLGLVWINLIQRRLTCRRRKDGRFEIRGFHPKALERMAQEKGITQMPPSLDLAGSPS